MSNSLINEIKAYILLTSRDVHERAVAAGWWTDLTTGESTIGLRDFISMCGLIITELTEAYDGYLISAKDDKLPDRPQLEVELADSFIRMGDTSYGCGVNLAAGLAAVLDGPLPFIPFTPTSGMAHRMMTTVGFISYAIEGHRKRDVIKRDINMVKAMLCIMVIGGDAGLDVRGAVTEKVAFNAQRPDHKMENRLKDGGKKE